MRKFLGRFFVLASGLLVSAVGFAQDGMSEGGMSGTGLMAIGSALAMGLAALGGTLGQGKAAGSALEGIARNPSSSDKVFMPMIIALALIEFQAIMGFIIAFLWYGK
jgi:F-type H+-transporting ATPase subunit c